ncbi:hypothetical protein FRC02_004700 [Tulasnella sp. 418]|nr:hypothetical protein FRC02_004700 [Tulasnella sp. 418]
MLTEERESQSIDPYDTFSTSLQTIFSEVPVSIADPTQSFSLKGVTVSIPSPQASNWALQADSIWRAALYLAENLPPMENLNVLELGAGAGLPGLVAANTSSPKTVVLSDYPDPCILDTLVLNTRRNQLDHKVSVIGHEWGDMSTSWPHQFDVIMAADILWISEAHQSLCATITRLLQRHENAIVHIVAGLHTGRWTIQRFLEKAIESDLVISSLIERSTITGAQRRWDVEREEAEADRRQWLISLTLKWNTQKLQMLQDQNRTSW